MMGPNLSWYLAVAAFLFAIGALGVMLRRSPLIVLLAAAVGGVVLGSQASDDQPKPSSNSLLQGGTRAE